jgi:hypothetical protein
VNTRKQRVTWQRQRLRVQNAGPVVMQSAFQKQRRIDLTPHVDVRRQTPRNRCRKSSFLISSAESPVQTTLPRQVSSSGPTDSGTHSMLRHADERPLRNRIDIFNVVGYDQDHAIKLPFEDRVRQAIRDCLV